MTNPTPRWKMIENVVAAIEGSLVTVEGATVIANVSIPERVSKKRRQVDVYVEIPTGARAVRVAIEVRDTSHPVDVPAVEQLAAKLGKLDIDLPCIVSRSGFTGDAMREAAAVGVELRTLASVGRPEWWLPSAIRVRQNRVQLVHMVLNFTPEEIASVGESLAGLGARDLNVHVPGDPDANLHDFVATQGVRALRDESPESARVDELVQVHIDMQLPAGTVLQSPTGTLPMPNSIDARFRVHTVTESVELEALASGDSVVAFTGLSRLFEKQMTLVANEQPDGTRRVSVSLASPNRPRTSVELRSRPD